MRIGQRSRLCTFALVTLSISVSTLLAQTMSVYPEDQLRQEEVAAHLRFLASDELMGRMTGTPWIDIAARYIAEQFRASGLSTLPGAEGYFQTVPLLRRTPAAKGEIVFLGDSLRQPETMLVRNGGPIDIAGEFVFVGFGIVDPSKNIDDYKGRDVKGKVVVAKFGTEGGGNLFASFTSLGESKRKTAADHGAVALIELYRGTRPWRSLASFASRSTFDLGNAGSDFPHFIVEDTTSALVAEAAARSTGPITVRTDGIRQEQVRGRNVIGYVRGSDPKLRNEYVLLTAHYDHLGTRKPTASSKDTIFNGARDNGMGVVGLIAAARSFALAPPRRSVIIAAVTGEEIGEFGSRYLSANPPVPMAQIVFDLNTDGAGYDDTTIVTVVGLERTTAEPAIQEGSQRYGLRAIADPVPEQNLFNRSDNVNFARRGVPAPTFSAGFHEFDDEILKYYHRVEDQADDSFNFSYFLKFCKAYVHSARVIADMKEKPFWRPGDPYEKAGRELYQK